MTAIKTQNALSLKFCQAVNGFSTVWICVMICELSDTLALERIGTMTGSLLSDLLFSV